MCHQTSEQLNNHDWFPVMKARNCQIELKLNTFSKVLRFPCYYNKTKQTFESASTFPVIMLNVLKPSVVTFVVLGKPQEVKQAN